MLENYNNILLDIYIIIPFIFAFLFGIFSFIKNPIYIRRITKTIFSILFVFAFIILTGLEYTNFNIFKINVILNKFSSIFIFINAFIFLIFSIISKTFIQKSQKLFSCVLFLLFGLLNSIILFDNITIIFGSIFWIFLICFLLNSNYDKKNKNKLLYKLSKNITLLAFCSILIFYDFARLFILNQTPFNYSNIQENLYHINNTSALIGFLGFLLLIFKFFNFIPFDKNIISSNPLISNINIITNFTIGNILLYKTFIAFDYLFYNLEQYIIIFLLINFIWFIILSFRQDSLIKIFNSTLPVFIIINIFALFSFEEKGIQAYLYSTITTLISYLFLLTIFAILINKFKSDRIEDIYKIPSKSKILKLFIILTLLNLIKIPPLALFTSNLFNFIMIFSVGYDEIIMQIIPYILVFGSFAISVCALNIFNKVLIEPQNTLKNEIKLANHQTITALILTIAIIILGIYPQYFFNGSF